MVANHALKKLARELIANSEHPLSYTDAMAHVTKINDLHSISTLRLTAESKGAIARAAQSLVAGSDLVIFGKSGTGKSTAAYSVLEEAQLRSLILTSHYLEAAYLRSYLNVPVLVQPQHLFAGIAPKLGVEVVVVDELRRSFADQGAQLSAAERRVIVVHGNDPDSARERIDRMLPELELRSPVFVEAIYDSKIDVSRRLRIYEGPADNLVLAFPPVARELSGVDLRSASLLTRRDGSDVTLGSATELEDILTLLRFAQETMEKRHREIEADKSNLSTALSQHDPQLIVVLEEGGELLNSRNDQWDEAGELVNSIAQLGSSAGVHLMVKPQIAELD